MKIRSPFLIVLVGALTSCATIDQTTIVPGKRAGPYELGAIAPSDLCDLDKGIALQTDQNSQITAVSITDTNMATSRGGRVGDDTELVITKYGKPRQTSIESTDPNKHLIIPALCYRGIIFIVYSNKVASIEIL